MSRPSTTWILPNVISLARNRKSPSFYTGRVYGGKPVRDTNTHKIRRESPEAAPPHTAPPDHPPRIPIIEETAELVAEAGGKGIAVPVDHLVHAEVASLVDRIRREESRLDILINDISGGEHMTEWDKPVWEHSLEKGLKLLRPWQRTRSGTALPYNPRQAGSRKDLRVRRSRRVADGLLARHDRGAGGGEIADASGYR